MKKTKTKPKTKTLQSQKQIRQSSNIAFDKQLHKSQQAARWQAGRQIDRQTGNGRIALKSSHADTVPVGKAMPNSKWEICHDKI